MISRQATKLARTVVFGAMMLACADQADFKGAKRQLQTEAGMIKEDDQVPVLVEAEVELPPVSIVEGQDGEIFSVTYSYGEPNPKVDYLFIIDNSVSMRTIVNTTRAGFATIVSQANVFSPDSQIAVMSTMIGDLNNFAVTGLDIRRYPGIDFEPGFLDFIDRASILNYRVQSPNNAGLWPMDGCAKKWFRPGERDDRGQFCFDAALQSTYAPVGAEPGIHAFYQLLLKNQGKPLFRSQSLLNVIFVSDTHDPGTNSPTLVSTRPTYQQIVAQLKKDNQVAGLKFHALAPSAPCTNELVYDQSYYKLADLSGGEKGDSCTLTDYSGFLRKMIAKSLERDPAFPLGKADAKDLQVFVDGVETKDYVLNEAKDKILIPSLNPSKAVKVTVSYIN